MGLIFSKEKETVIISGYPGTGKTTFTEKYRDSGLKISDSDSSKFSWVEKENSKERNPEFPGNYIDHIKKCIEEGYDIVFVSTHKEVINALLDAGIAINVVYPSIGLKDEYIKRYVERGSNEGFVNLMENSWDKFHDDINELSNNICKIRLTYPNLTIEDVIRQIGLI